MATRSYRIRGELERPSQAPELRTTAGVRIEHRRRLRPGRARDGVTGEHEVAADEVVRLKLDNGFVLWSRADALVREHGRRGLARDGGEAWEFDALLPAAAGRAEGGERGLLGLGIRLLDVFGVSLEDAAAKHLAQWFEERQLAHRKPDLYLCPLDGDFALSPLDADAAPPADQPLLIFLHGTASSCEGSFGKLWGAGNPAGREARSRLHAAYGARAFAFEHRSLSESPIANALALAQRLPKGAELHLVSHSRGGLVGELLCLGRCARVLELLSETTLETLFAADRTMAEQLGLFPLSPGDAAARDAAYDDDRAALAALVKLLVERDIRVTRFVRVACPARGTTLASGRLDRWLSMLGFLADKAAGVDLFADGLDFLLAVVKARTDPRTLPGLEAMMPGSALTRLLHHPELVTEADLSVIAGDVEGDTLWQKLKLLAADWFYGDEHDLVVNTGSMSGGLRRPDKGARFRVDKGAAVNHFGYFHNERSIGWLLAGLVRADHEDGGFLPIGEASDVPPRWREALERSQRSAAPRPLAVLLPGAMGSALRARGRPVWLDYRALLGGGLNALAIDAPEVTVDGPIGDLYGPLLEFLAHSHRVEVFPYDWRRSVREAAAKLAEALEQWLPQTERAGQPVHLVAHSMGGLVARAMIADGGRGAAVWQRIAALPGSRLLMLGTPNHGSWEAVRWLTGLNPAQARLALLDLGGTPHAIVDLMRDYPGLLELLPFADDAPDFTDPARWALLRHTTRAPWQTPSADALRIARDTWALLRGAPVDPDRMCCVAGSQPATVVDYQLAEYEVAGGEAAWLGDRKRLDFIASAEGDGTVSWASSRLARVSNWYLEDCAHDALCVQQRAFPAYLELLQTGRTTRLADTPPRRGRGGDEAAERFRLAPPPPADHLPAERDLCSLGFGGGIAAKEAEQDAPVPTIAVCIRHGDLSYARHPVLVGHYLGDTIVSAERTLDDQLDGALSRRLQLGIYPGRLDTNALFFNRRHDTPPGGAIVVGLGQVGELSPGLLESGVRAALLDYALQVSQWPNARFGPEDHPRFGPEDHPRFGPEDHPRRASVSCLLVGTGAAALTVRDSIEAILRAALATNARLVECELHHKVTIDRLEFIELFADIALGAAEALSAILLNEDIAARVRWAAQVVESGQAGRYRVRFDEAPEWWHRLEIVEDAGPHETLRFIFTTDRARAEETLASGQLALADAFIRAASRSARANPEAARTLYEMLLPLRLKEAARRQGDLVLLVDDRSARYPWELLENRWSDNGRPPAVSAGLVRQLKTASFRPQPAHPLGATALVIGNPDLGGWDRFDDLPGARSEAHKVVEVLSKRDWQVSACIDEPADTVIENLHRDAWRILHLAGHGEHDYALHAGGAPAEAAPQRVSGMVIGRDAFLTPGDIEQMRWVPELVFINCCHLGKTLSAGSSDRGALAANLGLQFIRMGVRAVVAAGWAVDDGAALAFAEAFYRRMLVGEVFGEAVRAAREEVWLRFPGVNTWGAYQCYGDPAYSLVRSRAPATRQQRPWHAPIELVVELDNLTQSLKVSANAAAGRDTATAERITGLLERIPQAQRETWLARAEVLAALGFAWGEARFWPAAIEALEKALAAAKGDCPLRAVEQLANFRARHAAEDWLARREREPAAGGEADAAHADAMKRALADLELLCRRAPTSERWNLLGSAWKRQALMAADAEGRRAALKASAEAYDAAFAAGERRDAYAFTNWASAVLLARQLGLETGQALDPGALDADIARLHGALQAREAHDPDFWNRAALADLELVRLLARCAPSTAAQPRRRKPGRPPSLDAECEALAERIAEAYASAIRRGASPREQASVSENLDCLLVLLGTEGGALGEALRRIRAAVPHARTDRTAPAAGTVGAHPCAR